MDVVDDVDVVVIVDVFVSVIDVVVVVDDDDVVDVAVVVVAHPRNLTLKFGQNGISIDEIMLILLLLLLMIKCCVLVDPRSLPLKSDQNWISNSRDIGVGRAPLALPPVSVYYNFFPDITLASLRIRTNIFLHWIHKRYKTPMNLRETHSDPPPQDS